MSTRPPIGLDAGAEIHMDGRRSIPRGGPRPDEHGRGSHGTPVIVVSPDDLRMIVKEAVRDALEEHQRRPDHEPLEWLDTAGAAALLGVHPRTVTKAAKAGELPCARIGKLYRFRRADVIAYLEKGRV